jgi:hypothetical protein
VLALGMPKKCATPLDIPLNPGGRLLKIVAYITEFDNGVES